MRAASNQPWAGRTWPPSVGPRSGKHCRSQGQRGPTGGRSRGVVVWWRGGGGEAGPGWRPSWQCGVAANARVQPAQAPRKGLGQKRADPGPSTLGYFLKHVSESTRGRQPKSLWLDTTTRCPARQQAQQQQPRGGGGRMHGTEPGPGRHRMGGWMMGAGHGSESRPWQGRARKEWPRRSSPRPAFLHLLTSRSTAARSGCCRHTDPADVRARGGGRIGKRSGRERGLLLNLQQEQRCQTMGCVARKRIRQRREAQSTL